MLETIRKNVAAQNREEGATAVEYGIMVALIAIVIIASVFFLGSALSDRFKNVGDCIEGAPDEDACPELTDGEAEPDA